MLLTDAKCRTCSGPVEVAKSSGRPFKYCSNQCRANWRHSVAITPKPKVFAIADCERCGKSYTPVSSQQKFCCEQCRYEYRRDRDAARRRAVAQKVNCKHCGNHIPGVKGNQQYCSRKCRELAIIAERKSRTHICECKTCGTVFSAKNRRSYCTEQCVPSVYRPVKRATKRCVACDAEFDATPNRKYCSPRCGRKTFKHNRRARVRHRRYEPINPQEIFKRDSWLCGICLAPVDMDAVVPAPLAATLDHIVPLSRGGHHEHSNVRCAHFMCNSIKSGKLDEEINWPAVDHQHQRTS